MLRALLAVILGLIHSMLAWLPWIRKSEVAVRDIRIRDDHTDRVVNVRMRGNPTSSIDLGDVVAVWGKWDGGTLVMNVAYNYTTQSDVKLKHK